MLDSKYNKTVAVVQARMNSTRLPGKVLMPLGGESVFAHHVARLRQVQGLDGVFLATSREKENEPLIAEAERLGCGWYAGAAEDIVERHLALCEREGADAVVRVTGDCPLFDPEITTRFLVAYRETPCDLVCCGNLPMLHGTLSELIAADALRRVHAAYRGPAISLPIREHPEAYRIVTVAQEERLLRPEYRLTLDEEDDYRLLSAIYTALYRGTPLRLAEVYAWLDDNPGVAACNRGVATKGVNAYAAALQAAPRYRVLETGGLPVVLDAAGNTVPLAELEAFIAAAKREPGA